VYFGDGEDPDFLESLPLKRARWVITSFPQWESNRALLHALQSVRYSGQVAGVVRDAAHGRATGRGRHPAHPQPLRRRGRPRR
jgi:hypothetical protein